MKSRLLILEDDENFRNTLIQEFLDRNYEVVGICKSSGFQRYAESYFDYAIIDLKLEGESGLLFLKIILEKNPACKALILTGYGSIATAVRAVKLGAVDYLTKPASSAKIEQAFKGLLKFDPDELAILPYNPPSLSRHEREYIESVLTNFDGNISATARFLGIHRQSLQRKLRKFPTSI